jgi:hypothetical protein
MLFLPHLKKKTIRQPPNVLFQFFSLPFKKNIKQLFNAIPPTFRKKTMGWLPNIYFDYFFQPFKKKTLDHCLMLFLPHLGKRPPRFFSIFCFSLWGGGSNQGETLGSCPMNFLPHPRRRQLGGCPKLF